MTKLIGKDNSVVERMRSLGLVVMLLAMASMVASHDYGDALSKSILFFEGQRSGKLPPSQRLTWRMDSALKDGSDHGVDLVGGYYDAGDNVKFHFPLAYSTTLLSWSVVEFGDLMQLEKKNALDALRWSTDYFLKATNVPGVIYAQVGDPVADHNCWERPEDMDTPRNSYAIDAQHPGSELAAEIAAAFAASSIAFRNSDPAYASTLFKRAYTVFDFADKHRGSYNAVWVCPFYCDNNGYMDELLWGAAWIYAATKDSYYLDYITKNSQSILSSSFAEFGWDSKFAGVNVLLSQYGMTPAGGSPFVQDADKLVCSILPNSPTKIVTYSPGGLMFKPGSSNMQHTTSLSFLLLVYSGYNARSRRVVQCGSVTATPDMLVKFAKSQVDYILGTNPKSMSYMVGYGKNFPQRIHHRGSSLPSKASHPQPIACKAGTPYFQSPSPNPNLLTGAVVGGPKDDDSYADSRLDAGQSEPTTYINAPFVGLLAYFKANP